MQFTFYPAIPLEEADVDKRKEQVVEPEVFDPDAPSGEQVILPGTPVTSPPVPGDDDDSDDEKPGENQAAEDIDVTP
ncbi:MAG TPA: hypothetical protein VM620_11300 [Hyphomicrobium sp.]|jgi:hypothetical protein|nr:hypothetical protein [Hyphomicrobium sp.]